MIDDPEEVERCCGCECGKCMYPGVRQHCEKCQDEYRRWLSLVVAQRNENVRIQSVI